MEVFFIYLYFYVKRATFWEYNLQVLNVEGAHISVFSLKSIW